jgi:hypothetical protein
MENCPTCPASYAKNGATIMNADGGVEVLINSANEVAGVSSQDRGRFSVLTKHRDMVYWSRVMEYA